MFKITSIVMALYISAMLEFIDAQMILSFEKSCKIYLFF
jgi:hypothetical protein